MIKKYLTMTDPMFEYILQHSVQPTPVLEKVRRETAKRDDAIMQINPNQGGFMYLLAKSLNAKRVVEVGCFTGYSALSVAQALGSDGKLFTFDINSETMQLAERYAREAGLDSRIEFRLGDAVAELKKFTNVTTENSFDLAFIDADKVNYPTYYEYCSRLLRKGGILLLDNALYDGEVVSKQPESASGQAIRALNEQIRADERVEACMLPVADGLYYIRKK
jgi:predicted O-methyltransferase YrrM